MLQSFFSDEDRMLIQNGDKYDRYDYLTAVACGVIGGLTDIFFVGTPNSSVLGKWSDTQVDNAVKRFARLTGWSPKKSDNVISAIDYLERKFRVNYDYRHSAVGAGILVGGIIFNFVGIKLSNKADEALAQMRKAEKTIDIVCAHLGDLKLAATKYKQSISTVRDRYKEIFGYVFYTVNNLHKTDWNDFSREERLATQNAVLLVGVLYEMCKVSLVSKANNENEVNIVNHYAINKSIQNANTVINSLA